MAELESERKAQEETNPHKMYTDIIAKPTLKGVFPITVMGRPVDLSKLENYVVFKMSPKSTVTTLRYNEVRSYEDVQGYGRKMFARKGGKSAGGVILLIMIAIAMAGGGAFFLLNSGNLSGLFGF